MSDRGKIPDNLVESYEFCRKIHRAHGRTYYLATRLLPAWKRPHVHALYGFTRHADDIVDSMDGTSQADRAAALRQWRVAFMSALAGDRSALAGDRSDDPILPAVLHTVETFNIDREDFATFLRSMEMDLTTTEYPTYQDLLGYMAGSAAAIGSMMLPILGADDLPAALEPARQLGLAFQLTNFIRDIGEDLDRGRIYLPLEDLAAHDVTPDDLRSMLPTTRVRALVAFEVERAREHYALAAAGIPMLDRSSRACVRAAYLAYGGILDEVVRAEYDVFRRRATVSVPRKLAIVASTLCTPHGSEMTAVPGGPR